MFKGANQAETIHLSMCVCGSVCIHEVSVSLLLVDLVADIVDVSWEVVLGVIMDDVADVGEHQTLVHAILQVLQKPWGRGGSKVNLMRV